LLILSPYDVFEYVNEVDAVVNTINTHGFMGKGLAKEFSLRFPELLADYKAACKNSKIKKGGDIWIWKGKYVLNEKEVTVINFATKEDPFKPSRIEWIERGLVILINKIEEIGISSIALPKLGANLGRLRWDCVENKIVSYLGELQKLTVYVCLDLKAGRVEKKMLEAIFSQKEESAPFFSEELSHNEKAMDVVSKVRQIIEETGAKPKRLRDVLKLPGVGDKTYVRLLKELSSAI